MSTNMNDKAIGILRGMSNTIGFGDVDVERIQFTGETLIVIGKYTEKAKSADDDRIAGDLKNLMDNIIEKYGFADASDAEESFNGIYETAKLFGASEGALEKFENYANNNLDLYL